VLEERCLPATMEMISNASSFPYAAAVEIVTTFPNSTRVGSGAMVDGTHVLTAGHMVYDPRYGGWATAITVYAGMTDRNQYNVQASGKWARTLQSFNDDMDWEWKNRGDDLHRAGNGDFGMITLGTDIGARTGSFAYGYDDGNSFAGWSLNTLGYPATNYSGYNQYYE
jgi:V8-like Glu-specific endopeptidase